ncbi:MAG: GC-type dockerin domain-anchored protein, partial [bacterium]
TGTTRGATSDGQFPCWPFNNEEPFNTKDIWFRYIPSASGYAEISSAGEPGQTPMISRFDGALGCGSASLQCAERGSSFAFNGRTRILTPVTQGVPVLLALGMLGGGFGELDLRITLLPPPCNLGTPADAILESETNCSENLNNGCNADPFAFDQLQLGRAFAGRVAGNSEAREQDWTEFTLPVRSRVTVTLVSQAPLWFEMWQRSEQPEDCYIPGTGIEFYDTFYSNACVPRGGTAELEPGVYRTLVQPFYVDNLVCGTGYEGYWFRIDAVPVPPPCPADITGIGGPPSEPDGLLTGDDFNTFIAAFSAGDLLADITGVGGPPSDPDGLITGDDFNAFISAFAAGCP